MTSVSDGLAEWVGRAGQVRVGHLIQGKKRTKADVWEVLETAIPAQIQTNYGHWWRVVNLSTGVEAKIPPKMISDKVVFMVPADQLDECERKGQPPWTEAEWPANSEEIKLLAEALGATVMFEFDNLTGEVTCPNYAAGARHTAEWSPGVLGRDELEHLRICHGIDTAGLEAKTGNDFVVALVETHGALHGIKQTPSPGGFPHRHAPEDHSLL